MDKSDIKLVNRQLKNSQDAFESLKEPLESIDQDLKFLTTILDSKYKERLSMDQLVNSIALAKDFHDFFQKMSKIQGWKTQESCQVEFHELPEKNKRAMVDTASEILKRYFVIPKEKIYS